MLEVPMEDLLKKTNSIFKLVNLASRRTTELCEGYRPRLEVSSTVKPQVLALREIAAGKIDYEMVEEEA